MRTLFRRPCSAQAGSRRDRTRDRVNRTAVVPSLAVAMLMAAMVGVATSPIVFAHDDDPTKDDANAQTAERQPKNNSRPVMIPTLAQAAKVNDHTIGVVFTHEELFHQLVHNMEDELEPASGLRIVPIMGKNHVQSIYDLLYLSGIDLAMVRSDAIEYVKRKGNFPTIYSLLRSVAKVSEEKIVVVAGKAYETIDDLLGLEVGFGLPGSGEFVTGSIAFDSLGIYPEVLELDNSEALDMVKSGKLAAMVYLLRAPDAIQTGADLRAAGNIRDIEPDDNVHVIALPENDVLNEIYETATLTSEELPGLIPEGEEIATYSVDAILAAYNWQSNHPRFAKVSRFVDAFVTGLDGLRKEAYEPVWKRVDIEEETPGVARLSLVEEMLSEKQRLVLESKLAEEKRLAEEKAAAKAAKIAALTKQRNEITKLLGEKITNADTAEVERLLGELNEFLEALEREPTEPDDTQTAAKEGEGG